MRNAVVMAIKDLHLLWRDKFGLFWVVVFPLMMALFVGAIFGGSGPTAGMSLAVVDLDSTAALARLRRDARPLRRDPAGGPGRRLDLHARSARADRRGGRRHRLPADARAVTARRPRPRCSASAARRSSWASIRRAAPKRVTSRGSCCGPLRADPREPRRADFEPVRVELEPVLREGRRPPNAFGISFPQAMSWGVIGCCASFAVGLVQERARGTYGRLRMAPNPAWAILAGKAIACFTTCVGSTLLFVALG